MARAHDPDAVITKVLGRFHDKREREVGRSRGVLVLEPKLAPLAPALNDANFIIIVPDKFDDLDRRRELLSGRVLITRHTAQYIDDAPAFEFGIVGLDALGGDIYVGPTLAESATATLISTAFIDFDLGRERGSDLLLLHPEGRHVFRRLS